MQRTVALFVLVLFFGACVRLDTHGFDKDRLCEDLRHPEKIIALQNYTPFEWDRFFVFGPRDSREAIARVIGASVAFPHKELETHCLLIFLRAGKVVAAFEESRSEVDFIALTRPAGYAPSEAKFRGSPSASGIRLGPPDLH